MNTDEKKFKHKELTYKILNAAFEVHNILGCGFLEKVYENALLHELDIQGMRAEAQKEIQVIYKDHNVGSYMADIVVEDSVILELKAVERITKLHKAQLLNYLKATGYEVGMILNFARPRLEYHRFAM